MIPYNKKLQEHSRELRENMTDAGRLLWSKLRRKQILGLRFCRQRIIGNYIVDFCCPKAKLVVEVDGGGHYDTPKDGYMMKFGLTVLRFSDREVFKEMDGVLEEILKYL